jgi:hypothetical protein
MIFWRVCTLLLVFANWLINSKKWLLYMPYCFYYMLTNLWILESVNNFPSAITSI